MIVPVTSDGVSLRLAALRAALACGWWRWGLPGQLSLARLARLRDRLRHRRTACGAMLAEVEARLAAGQAGAAPLPRPLHADWAWRPPVWAQPLRPAGLAGARPGARLCAEIAVFHDCPLRETLLRQVPGEDPASPYALLIDVLGFTGSFLSLAIDLPGPALAGLGGGHIVSARLDFDAAAPVAAVARLNLRQGPEQHRLARALVPGTAVDFDLAAAGLDARAIGAGWLDIIVQDPGANRVVLRDLVLARRPRAEF